MVIRTKKPAECYPQKRREILETGVVYDVRWQGIDLCKNLSFTTGADGVLKSEQRVFVEGGQTERSEQLSFPLVHQKRGKCLEVQSCTVMYLTVVDPVSSEHRPESAYV